MSIVNQANLRKTVDDIVNETQVMDIHTHLFAPSFHDLLLWGFDELITYHYLVAETLRWVDMPYQYFWALPKSRQADLVWNTLFLENSPYSEACRGVLTVLERLGLDVASRDIRAYRNYFQSMDLSTYIDKVFELAKVKAVVMTNDPFDSAERDIWLGSYEPDPRFKAALRLDPLLNSWESTHQILKGWGYNVDLELSSKATMEVCRFLEDWSQRMDPLYMAVSLPPDFTFPEDSPRGRLIKSCILPVSRNMNVPFAMMIGVKKLINPGLKTAGDGLGRADTKSVEFLCAKYPENKFLVTMLSRENQHELAVIARKFENLMIFGCWWFLNNPTLIQEITNMRLELLGVSFIPQHSDARVLDQLIYKWDHSRRIISDALVDKYGDLLETGWRLESAEIQRDVEKLLYGNFWGFLDK